MFEKFTADNIRKWEDSKNISKLIEALGYKDEKIQNLASLALQRIGEEAVEKLIKALGSANIQVRSNATKVLVSIGNVAVEKLIRYLRDEDFSGIFPEIVRVLGSIRNEKAIEVLAEKLKDEDAMVREAATDALEKIGISKAKEAVERHHRSEAHSTNAPETNASSVGSDDKKTTKLEKIKGAFIVFVLIFLFCILMLAIYPPVGVLFMFFLLMPSLLYLLKTIGRPATAEEFAEYLRESERKWIKQKSRFEKLSELFEKNKLEFELNLSKYNNDLQMLSKVHYDFARECDFKFYESAKIHSDSYGNIFSDSYFPFLAEAKKEYEWVINNSTNNKLKKDAEKRLTNIEKDINEKYNEASNAVKALSKSKGEEGMATKDYLSRIEASFPELKIRP